jgi:hypothetical protein
MLKYVVFIWMSLNASIFFATLYLAALATQRLDFRELRNGCLSPTAIFTGSHTAQTLKKHPRSSRRRVRRLSFSLAEGIRVDEVRVIGKHRDVGTAPILSGMRIYGSYSLVSGVR